MIAVHRLSTPGVPNRAAVEVVVAAAAAEWGWALVEARPRWAGPLSSQDCSLVECLN